MIDDPDEPGYRYPDVGERLWHWIRWEWCVVESAAGIGYSPRVLSEVPVRFDNGDLLVAKMRNLDTEPS